PGSAAVRRALKIRKAGKLALRLIEGQRPGALPVDRLNLLDRFARNAVGWDGEHGLPRPSTVFGSQDHTFAWLGAGGGGLLARDLGYVPIGKTSNPPDALVNEAKGGQVADRDGKALPRRSVVAGLCQSKARAGPAGDV